MKIREARLEDVEQFVALVQSTLPPEVQGFTLYDCNGIAHYVRENIRAANFGGENCYAVAIADGAIVGGIEIQLTPAEIFVKYVAVAPEYRRKGIANALLAEALAAYPGKKKLSLHVLQSNTAAVNWYYSLGMKKISEVSWYAGDMPQSASTGFAVLGGYAQMVIHLERFGFAMLMLKNLERTTNVGVLNEQWLRFTSWDDISQLDFVASLRRIWPTRRALVITGVPCPGNLLTTFRHMARFYIMQACVRDVSTAIAEK
jgi:ribosomal protein S18 acetylase RimI-like enzyme